MTKLSYEEAKDEFIKTMQQQPAATRQYSLGYIAAMLKHEVVSVETWIKLTKLILGDVLKN